MMSSWDPQSTAAISSELKSRGFLCQDTIGEGTFSIVKLAWSNRLEKIIAMKIIDKRKDFKYCKRCLPRELQIVRKVDHNNIIRVYETGRVDESESKFFYRQIMEALINVKLADFGFARFMKPGERSRTFCGSRAYLSPEIIRKTVRRLSSRYLERRYCALRDNNRLAEVKQLIFEILHPIPTKRPSLDDIIHSKWLATTGYKMRVGKSRSESQ
uniref:Protein kinase domain-containing protein n=1 Tax=Parascaris equorum TaxID=6256 RepID=A0A914S6N9_PAREQ